MIVVSDTTPVSSLILIGQLPLLRELFGSVIIPVTVANELRRVERIAVELNVSLDWIDIRQIADSGTLLQLRGVLDAGESEAIGLAKELGADFLLIDERKGYRIARELGLKTTGTIGILLRAKETGLIPSVKEHLLALKDNTDFWVSDDLITSVLRAQNEL